MISGRCSIFLSLHGRIDPETRKSDPHHAGIKELPGAFTGSSPHLGGVGATLAIRIEKWAPGKQAIRRPQQGMSHEKLFVPNRIEVQDIRLPVVDVSLLGGDGLWRTKMKGRTMLAPGA